MQARYIFQCRLTGLNQAVTFIDKENNSIESQARKYSHSSNQEIVDYKYY